MRKAALNGAGAAAHRDRRAPVRSTPAQDASAGARWGACRRRRARLRPSRRSGPADRGTARDTPDLRHRHPNHLIARSGAEWQCWDYPLDESRQRCARQGRPVPRCRYEAWLSHKSATTAVRCRFLQRLARCERTDDADCAYGRGGRRHVRELVGDFSNVLDLCDTLRQKEHSRRVVSRAWRTLSSRAVSRRYPTRRDARFRDWPCVAL